MSNLNHSGIAHYFEAIKALQHRVIESQHTLLQQVAAAMATTIEGQGRILTFGTGHSHMLAEEGHFRAGGLAAIVPILLSALMLHECTLVGSQLERTGGIAAPLLDRYKPRAGEMLFIFSNSGVNLLPVELAMVAKERGLSTVAICSLAYARVAPLSPIGKRLPEVVDYVIDNGGEPGDGLVPLPDTPWRVGPGSTVIGTLLWNCLITEVAFELQARSAAIPLYASANLPGATVHNASLLKQWGPLNPHI